jgi:membrane protease YdiL (CAAX protease family)
MTTPRMTTPGTTEPPGTTDAAGPSQAAASGAVTIPSWSRRQVLGVWAAAALPMAFLAWVAAPALARALTGPAAVSRSLILCLAAGMGWQCLLVLLVVRREQGTLRWAVLKEALWLNAPSSPRTGKRGGRLWWVLVPAMALLAAEEFLPTLATPAGRDLSAFFGSDAGQSWMSGNWTWFAVLVVMWVFNTVLGEELLFRGLLLSRMGKFGRADWLVNGLLFGLYHLHVPWVIPQTVLVDTFALALPSRRYRSALIGIAAHSAQTVFFMVTALVLVLR